MRRTATAWSCRADARVVDVAGAEAAVPASDGQRRHETIVRIRHTVPRPNQAPVTPLKTSGNRARPYTRVNPTPPIRAGTSKPDSAAPSPTPENTTALARARTDTSCLGSTTGAGRTIKTAPHAPATRR